MIVTTTTVEDGYDLLFIPPQLAINVQSVYAVHSSSTTVVRYILPAVRLELSKHWTHIYIPPRGKLCGYTSPTTSGLPLREVVLHRKEIRFYLYTRVQRNYFQFTYTCSKNLDLIYKHVFKEIRSYLYARVPRN